jgi:hypothetical protein
MPKRYFLAIAVLSLLGISCRKQVSIVSTGPNASLTIVNAVPASSGLIPMFWADSSVSKAYQAEYENQGFIGYGLGMEFGFPSGTVPVVIYDASDTLHPLLNTQMTFQPYGMYSLFLSGSFNAQNGPDTLLVMDTPLAHPVGDSAVGIRFVNLLQGKEAVSVDIQGNPPGSEVNSLNYQGVTAFKDYSATSAVPNPSTGYIFEFRSVTTGNVMTTFSYTSLDRFKNVSIILAGSDSNLTTFVVDNY